MIHYSRDVLNGGWRGSFVVKNSIGTLRTGIPSGSFAVTIVNPQDTAQVAPTVVESTQKPGLYRFLIADSFLTAHGLGSYDTVVEVNVVGGGPAFRDAVGAPFGYFEGVVSRRANAWFRGRIALQNDDEIVYYAEDGLTALFRNNKLDSSREVMAP